MRVTTLFSIDEASTINGDVIENVIVCGRKSKNKREYTDDALKGAVRLYEGMGVYCDHLTPEERRKRGGGRKLEERLGHLEAVRWCPDERRPRGNLRLMESHPMTARVKEAYAKGLPYFGLSHVIDGRGYVKDGITYVQEVTRVMSVDLVDNAATGTIVEQEEAPAGDPFKMAVMGLLDTDMDKDAFLSKVGELWDTLKGDGEATPAETPAEEQVSMANINAIIEQRVAEALSRAKPAPKYVKPKAAPLHVAEQTTTKPAIPTDRKALGAWVRSNAD